MKKRKQQSKPTPELLTDPSHNYILLCLACGKETGQTMPIRQSLGDPVQLFGPDPKNWKLRKGLCNSCFSETKRGNSILFSDTRGVILKLRKRDDGSVVLQNKLGQIVRLEGEIIGKCTGISEEMMDQILGPRASVEKVTMRD